MQRLTTTVQWGLGYEVEDFHDNMQLSLFNMFALHILVLSMYMIRNRFILRQGGGGGNMVLSIGSESVDIPREFEKIVTEAFNSLKKGLLKTGGRRRTRRKR